MMLPPTLIIAMGEGKILPRPSFRFAPVTGKKRNLNRIERFLKRLYYYGAVFADEVPEVPSIGWKRTRSPEYRRRFRTLEYVGGNSYE